MLKKRIYQAKKQKIANLKCTSKAEVHFFIGKIFVNNEQK